MVLGNKINIKKKNSPNLNEKKFIEDCLINWCIKHINIKIEKKILFLNHIIFLKEFVII